MPNNGRNESRHPMPGKRRKKKPDDIRRNGHRKKGHTKKGRDVDVRNGREMVAELNRKMRGKTTADNRILILFFAEKYIFICVFAIFVVPL